MRICDNGISRAAYSTSHVTTDIALHCDCFATQQIILKSPVRSGVKLKLLSFEASSADPSQSNLSTKTDQISREQPGSCLGISRQASRTA